MSSNKQAIQMPLCGGHSNTGSKLSSSVLLMGSSLVACISCIFECGDAIAAPVPRITATYHDDCRERLTSSRDFVFYVRSSCEDFISTYPVIDLSRKLNEYCLAIHGMSSAAPQTRWECLDTRPNDGTRETCVECRGRDPVAGYCKPESASVPIECQVRYLATVEAAEDAVNGTSTTVQLCRVTGSLSGGCRYTCASEPSRTE